MRGTCVSPNTNLFPDLGTILPEGVDASNPRVRKLLGTPFMQRALCRPLPTDAELEAMREDWRGRRRQDRRKAPAGSRLPAAPANPYGPRQNRGRWQDMRAKLPRWLLGSNFGLTEAIGAVLYTLVRELRQKDTVSIALDAIAAYAGTSQKTVERAIAALERLGLISILRGGWSRQINRRVANRYALPSERLRAWARCFFGEKVRKSMDSGSPTSMSESPAAAGVFGGSAGVTIRHGTLIADAGPRSG